MPVYSSYWQTYTWKNELSTQLDRVLMHSQEIIDEAYAGPHDPLHMLERAIVLAGFCIRRMIEKHLVTDALANSTTEVTLFTATDGESFRMPYHSATGSQFFNNYVYSEPKREPLKLKSLADEIIHSSQLMVVGDEENIQDGLMIASDWHLRNRVIHLTFDEFRAITKQVLDDQIGTTNDTWDPNTGSVSSTRE